MARWEFLTYLSRSEFWIVASAVASFLVLTWVLRGAPLGQAAEAEEDADAPRAAYRDRMVVGVVVGLILMLGGVLVAFSQGIPWSLPVFGMGIALVLTLIAVNHRYRHASPSLRRTIEFSGALLNSSLLAGILIVINVIAFRYGGQPLDLTRERTYSLASLTTSQLRSLDRPVTFTMIFGQGAVASKEHDRVLQLLESFKAVNPQLIRIVGLNPYYDLSRIDELGKRAPEIELLRGGGVLVEYGEGSSTQYVVVRNQDMFARVPVDPRRAGFERFETSFTGEDELTSALLRLREGKRPKVAFTVGHGEPSTGDLKPSGLGIGNWKTRLVKTGSEVLELDLNKDDVPQDLTLLLIVGPRTAFLPEELIRLRAYADRGGPLLVLVEDAEIVGLNEFLRSFNLEIGRGLVADLQFNYLRNPYLVLAPLSRGSRHPISDPLGSNRAVYLPRAAPIRVLGTGTEGAAASQAVRRDLVPTPFLYTSNSSWTETNPDNPRLQFDSATDKPGPVIVGVAVAERQTAQGKAQSLRDAKPRLVLFSSPGLAANHALETDSTNLDLLMNAASWLRGRTDTVGIVPKTHVALTLAVDPVLRSRLILVPTVTALLCIIALGVVLYVARRE